jgi:hypothetical protein
MRGSGSPGERPGAAGAGRRADRLALAILTAVLALLFADVLLGASTFYLRDIVYGAYPSKSMLRSAILSGEFPYWNRWIGAGQPLAANPAYQLFYPPTWLILIPDLLTGFNLLLLLHVFLAAYGMYALLRSMDAAPPASAIGGVSFALGAVLAVHDLLPLIVTLAWLPWTCLFTRRFLRDRRRRDFALAALCLGVELLLGEAALVLQTGAVLGFYALFRERRARNVGAIALLCVVAVLLAAVQLVPTVDLARDSVRAEGFPFTSVVSWSMPLARVGELLNPNFLGHQMLNGRAVYWGSPLYGERGLPFVRSIYPGIVMTALFAAGVIAGVRGRRVACTILALALLLALGAHTPLWRLLYESGLARSIRYPEKFILMGLFALVVFGAKTLDRMLAGDEEVLRAAKRVTAAIAIVLGAMAVFALTSLYAPLFIRLWNPSQRMFAEMLPASRSGWLLAAGRAALLFILLRNLDRVRRPLWLALAGALVLLDLGMIVPELAPRMPRAYFAEEPRIATELKARYRDCRLFHAASWEPAGAYQSQQPDLYWIERNALYPMMPPIWGIATAIEPDLDKTSLVATARFNEAARELLRRGELEKVAAMANVCAVALHEDPRVAYARAGDDRTNVQPVRLIALPVTPRYVWDGATPPGQPAGHRRSTVIAKETANTARIEVDAAEDGFLYMSVTPHKYWQVAIDGRPATAVVANIGFQGVAVPRGHHVVEMRYRNPLFLVGGAISLVTLAALLLWSMLSSAPPDAAPREESHRRPSGVQRRAHAPGDV